MKKKNSTAAGTSKKRSTRSEKSPSAVPVSPLAAARSYYAEHDFTQATNAFAVADAKYPLELIDALNWLRSAKAIKSAKHAVDASRRILTVTSSYPEALRVLARNFEAEKQWQRADATWRTLFDALPEDAEAGLQVARFAARAERWDVAAVNAEVFLRHHPTNIEAVSVLANAQIKLGHFGNIAPNLVTLVRGNSTRVQKLMTSFLEAAPPSESAQLLHDLRDALPANATVSQWFERSLVSLRSKLRSALRRKDVLEAAALWRAIRRLAPNDASAQSGLDKLVANAVKQVRTALRAGDNEAAETAASEAIALDPDNVQSHFQIARLEMDAGLVQRAVPRLQACVQREPDRFEFHLALGEAAKVQRDYGVASEAFRNAIRVAELPTALGTAAPESAQQAKALLAKLTDDVTRSFRVALKSEDDQRVRTAAAAVLAINPLDHNLRLSLGKLELERGSAGRAVEHLTQFLDHSPNLADAWKLLGDAHAKLTQWDQAVTAYHRALQELPVGDSAGGAIEQLLVRIHSRHYKEGRALFTAGDLEGAWTSYRIAANAQPADPAAQKMLSRIGESLERQLAVTAKDNPAAAQELAQRIHAVAPELLRPIQLLAKTAQARRDFATAQPLWTRLTELEPAQPTHWLQLARCCGWTKSWDLGAVAIEHLHQLGQHSAEIEVMAGRFKNKVMVSGSSHQVPQPAHEQA
jgi:tetratricopeptide (TPR) repeat protein